MKTTPHANAVVCLDDQVILRILGETYQSAGRIDALSYLLDRYQPTPPEEHTTYPLPIWQRRKRLFCRAAIGSLYRLELSVTGHVVCKAVGVIPLRHSRGAALPPIQVAAGETGRYSFDTYARRLVVERTRHGSKVVGPPSVTLWLNAVDKRGGPPWAEEKYEIVFVE